MAQLNLMSFSTYPSRPFHHEQALCRVSKELQTSLPSPRTRKEIGISASPHLKAPPQLADPWKPMGWNWMVESNHFVKLDSTLRKPVLVDVQDVRPDSVLFNFDINGQCTRYKNILKFLMSGSNEAGKVELDINLLSDLMGVHKLETQVDHRPTRMDGGFCFYEFGNNNESQSSLVHLTSELYSQKPLLDFIGDLARNSQIMVDTDGRVLFSGTRAEMKDLLSVVAEFYLSKNSIKLRNSLMLVPPFPRVAATETQGCVQGSSLTIEAVTVAPLKSPKKVKLSPLPKKKRSRKLGNERDVYKRSSFHACESLLSVIADKRRGKGNNTAILSLKKSGPELPQLLNQFSASIAGTGLAVLFSVIFKVAGGRVPFGASKMLNTGLGLGLVWLSWAVNKLRDSIIYVSKNTNKSGAKDDKEIIRRLDTSVNEIFFRAATLMAFAVLKFA